MEKLGNQLKVAGRSSTNGSLTQCRPFDRGKEDLVHRSTRCRESESLIEVARRGTASNLVA
jgi:hypothetical protein